ncbi:hypothetical protein D9757_004558 [Collybiopsis confluens]|uniref:Uncharacterized protein n=1 Tax=Collybiopsis confluens TaxID=2823264 RepID=A0A8H5HX59_9AGAR|nr:hypothetical protein D9757_004558 [Collybiopsis confluens]
MAYASHTQLEILTTPHRSMYKMYKVVLDLDKPHVLCLDVSVCFHARTLFFTKIYTTMFSTRNVQNIPGVKSGFAVQGQSKGIPGVHVFKGPTFSTFNMNPLSALSARFDSFDVGYRPTQPDGSQRLNGSRNVQPQHSQSWQPPANMYLPSHPPPPPPPPSHSYQQNPAAHNAQFGARSSNGASSSVSSRSQQPPPPPPRQQSHGHPSNYSIHPGISTDMYIYEASDAFSEFSPSPRPFLPELPNESSATRQTVIPISRSQSTSRDRDGRATPSLRTPTPAPSKTGSASGPNGSQPQSQPYPTNPYPSNQGPNGIPFPSGASGMHQAQPPMRGIFGTNGQVDRDLGPGRAFPPPSTTFVSAPRARASSSMSNRNVFSDSETDSDRLARANTALNAGYSYYYPESQVPNPARSTSPNAVGTHKRSPRDSLMFYNGIQHIQHSPDLNTTYPPLQPAPPSTSTTPVGKQASQRTEAPRLASSPLNPVITPAPPPIGLSISNSSQSSEYSILEVPSRSTHVQEVSSLSQTSPAEQAATNTPTTALPTYATVLSASPEPQYSHPNSSFPYSQIPAQVVSPTQSHSSSSSTTLNRSESSSSSTSTVARDRGTPSASPAGTVSDRAGSASLGSSQNYPMPRGAVATEDRSINGTAFAGMAATVTADPLNITQSGRRRSQSPPSDRNRTYDDQTSGQVRTAARPDAVGTTGFLAHRTSVSSTSPNSSPPRMYSRPNGDRSALTSAAPSVPAPTAGPAAGVGIGTGSSMNPVLPQHQQPPQARVRKDSTSQNMSSTPSTSHRTSRSYPNPPASYSNTNMNLGHGHGPYVVNAGPNSEMPAATTATSTVVQAPVTANPVHQLFPSTVPTRTPSRVPEPVRRHSDGENPSLTDASTRSSVPFQTEFIPSLSNAASAATAAAIASSHRTVVKAMFTQNQSQIEKYRLRCLLSVLSLQEHVLQKLRLKLDLSEFPLDRWIPYLCGAQRKRGWFNRRGDQLWTNGGAFKGPQKGHEYPPDLDGYPEFGDGWMNEEGVRIDMAHRLIPKTPLRSALKTKRGNAPSHTGL